MLDLKEVLFYISDFLSDEDSLKLFITCKKYNEILKKNKKWYRLKKWNNNYNYWLYKEYKTIKFNFFTPYFKHEYDISIIPDTVTHLIFGYWFNQPLVDLPSRTNTSLF